MISALASFILGINKFFGNFFSWFNNFYDDCGDYLYRNIKNGKIFYDLGTIEKKITILSIKFIITEYKSPAARKIISDQTNNLNSLSRFSIVNKFLIIVKDARQIYKNNTRFFLLTALLTVFPVIIYTINIISTSLSQFFINLVPIVLIILYFQSCLYIYIHQKENGTKISLLKSFTDGLSGFHYVILLFLFYIFLTGSLLYIITLLITFSVQSFAVTEYNSALLFLYLFIILFICTSFIFLIIYLTILFFQSFLLTILENEMPVNTLLRGFKAINKNFFYVFGYSIIYLSISIFILIMAINYFSDIALQFITTLIIHLSFLFAFSLRRTHLINQLNSDKNYYEKKIHLIFFGTVILIGIVGYIAFSTIILRFQSSFTQFYSALQYEINLKEQFFTYTNLQNKYTVFYPKTWKVKVWNPKSASIYYNENNTSSGAISVNIDVLPIFESEYFTYDNLTSGTVIENQETKENTTIDAKLFIAGHNALKYRVIRQQPGNNRFEINYLIQRGDFIYKISFVTANSIFQQTYTKTFDTIITSFKFIE